MNFNTKQQDLEKLKVAKVNFSITRLDSKYGLSRNLNNRDGVSEQLLHIILYEGFGKIFLEHQEITLTDNQLLILKLSQPGRITLNPGSNGFLIIFNSSFLELINRYNKVFGENIYHSLQNKEIPIETPLTSDLKAFAELLLKEFTCEDSYKMELLQHYFLILYIHILRKNCNLLQNHYSSRNDEIVNSFKSALENNFKTKKMVADYANVLAVTPNYLNEVIKKSTGYSAGYHIRQRIALEAKLQTSHSNNCMKAIAYDLGFNDMAHFSKFFKKTIGMNFSEYKNQGKFLQPVA